MRHIIPVMDMLSAIWEWVCAVLSAWYGWVGGSATAGMVGFGQSVGWWNPNKRYYIWLIVFGFLVSMFQAWHSENISKKDAEKKTKAIEKKIDDGRPRISLKATDNEESAQFWKGGNVSFAFWVENFGERVARSVRFSPIPSKDGKLTLQLDELPLLNPHMSPPVSFYISSTRGKPYMLPAFFEAGLEPNFIGTLTYDLNVTFLDTNEELLSEKMIMECKMPEVMIKIIPVSRQLR